MIGEVLYLVSLILFLCTMPFVPFYMMNLRRFAKSLEEEDRQLWEKMGRPGLSFDASPFSFFRIFAYAWSRGYEANEASEVRSRGERFRQWIKWVCLPNVIAVVGIAIGMLLQ